LFFVWELSMVVLFRSGVLSCLGVFGVSVLFRSGVFVWEGSVGLFRREDGFCFGLIVWFCVGGGYCLVWEGSCVVPERVLYFCLQGAATSL
jgi:hypothetical protein